jgi:hypothetical protein
VSERSAQYVAQLKSQCITLLGSKCSSCEYDQGLKIVVKNRLNAPKGQRPYKWIDGRYRYVRDHPEEFRLLCPKCYVLNRVQRHKGKSKRYARHYRGVRYRRKKPKFVNGKFIAGKLEIPYYLP